MARLTRKRFADAVRYLSPWGDRTEEVIETADIETLVREAILHVFNEQIPENEDTAVIRQVLRNIRAAPSFTRPDYWASQKRINDQEIKEDEPCRTITNRNGMTP